MRKCVKGNANAGCFRYVFWGEGNATFSLKLSRTIKLKKNFYVCTSSNIHLISKTPSINKGYIFIDPLVPGIQVYLQPLPLLVPLKLQLTLITLMDCLISSSFFVLSLIKCLSSDLFFPRLFCVSKIKTRGGNWNLLSFKVLHTGRKHFVSYFQVFYLYMQMQVPSIIPSIQILLLTQQFALKQLKEGKPSPFSSSTHGQ